MRIGKSARKHEIADKDIWHAIRNAIRLFANDDEVTILVGPARDGALLEIGVLDFDGDDPLVVHALPLRPKYYPYL